MTQSKEEEREERRDDPKGSAPSPKPSRGNSGIPEGHPANRWFKEK